MKYTLVTLASILVLLACKSSKNTAAGGPPNPPVISAAQMEITQKRWPNTMPGELEEGQSIYTIKCTKCHANFEITKFSEKKWLHEIDDMSPKAKLTPEEKLKLTKHILSYREANTPSTKN